MDFNFWMAAGAYGIGHEKVKKLLFIVRGGQIEIWKLSTYPPLVPRALPGTVSLLLLSPR
jgi:hypothetical protein